MLKQGTSYEAVNRLLGLIADGTLVLPAFQRDYDWEAKDARALLATVLMGWPAGSLLILRRDRQAEAENKNKLEVRSFELGPPVNDDYELIVLDGQQRLTALYHALYDLGPTVYALSADALRANTVEDFDDAIESIERRRWETQHRGQAWDPISGLIPFYALCSQEMFSQWQRRAEQTSLFDQADSTVELDELYSRFLHNLQDYKFATTEIEVPSSPADVARIFERVNRTGLSLGAFDLVVARTYRFEWDLREHWDSVRLAEPSIDEFLGENGMPLLQIISLRELKDVRKDAALSLDPTVIERDWNGAVAGLRAAIEFVQKYCGVAEVEWLPYQAMLVVLGAFFQDRPLGPQTLDVARDWFVSRAFSLRFDAAVNTRITEEWRSLAAANGSRELPQRLFEPETLRRATRQSHRALWRAFLCLLTMHDALDLQGDGFDAGGVSAPLLRRVDLPDGIATTLVLNQVLASRGTAAALFRGDALGPQLIAVSDHALASQFLPGADELEDLTRTPSALFDRRLASVQRYLLQTPGLVLARESRTAVQPTDRTVADVVAARETWLERLRTDYILTHVDVDPGIASGDEPLPTSWLLEQIQAYGLDELFADYPVDS